MRMKYTAEIEIDLPRDQVVDLYNNKTLYPQWHASIKEIELVSGKAGEAYSKYRIIMERDGQIIEFQSTVTKNKLPDECWSQSIKENDFTLNKKMYFKEVGPDKTKIIEEYEMHLHSFETDIQNNLLDFKIFSENHG